MLIVPTRVAGHLCIKQILGYIDSSVKNNNKIYKFIKIISMLIGKGADVNARNNINETPLIVLSFWMFKKEPPITHRFW